jgi:hypothetical protein
MQPRMAWGSSFAFTERYKVDYDSRYAMAVEGHQSNNYTAETRAIAMALSELRKAILAGAHFTHEHTSTALQHWHLDTTTLIAKR